MAGWLALTHALATNADLAELIYIICLSTVYQAGQIGEQAGRLSGPVNRAS